MPETALDPGTPVIHPELGDNLTFERKLDAGEVDKAFAESDAVVGDHLRVRPPHRRLQRAARRSSPTGIRASSG